MPIAQAGPDVAEHRKAEFLRLYEQYRSALGRLAAAYVDTAADREDLAQEIAAAIWQALPGFRGESSERTWFYRIAHNVAITASTRLRRRTTRESAQTQPMDYPAAGRTAEQQMLADEKRRMLIEEIRHLPEADRQLVILHLEGLSYAEIEEISGVSEGTLAVRLTRIREKMRRAIRAREAGNER